MHFGWSGCGCGYDVEVTFVSDDMQVVLLYSGMRGAVSLALAENIPLFDVVTKNGSKYKAALKAMTSSSIIFTVFCFGASSYYTLKRQRDAQHNEVLDGDGTSGRSLMTSLLDNNSLELREDRDHTTPPWIDQSGEVQNVEHAPPPETTFV